MINENHVRTYAKEAIIPPRQPGGDYACVVPLKFGGSLPLVNVITGEQCPNSDVTQSINFRRNPGHNDVREEAGVSETDVLEKCVWMTPTEATVLKMAQVVRRRNWQARMRKVVLMRRGSGARPDPEACQVLEFLIGQFQPYFKRGKFTHLKHPLGYRTCYQELAKELGWEEWSKHTKKRMSRVISNLIDLGFIEKQLVSHAYTKKKLWFNVTFLRVVPENLFPILDPTGYKKRKDLMENSGGDGLFVMMNHRTIKSVAKSDRVRTRHLFGPQTLSRMDVPHLYGNKDFCPDFSEFYFFPVRNTDNVGSGKVVDGISCNSSSSPKSPELLSANTIHTKKMKNDLRSLPHFFCDFYYDGYDKQGARLRDTAMAWSTRQHSFITPANSNTPAPLTQQRRDLIIAAARAFHGEEAAIQIAEELSTQDTYYPGTRLFHYRPTEFATRAVSYLPTGSVHVPIRPNYGQPGLFKIFDTANTARIMNTSTSFNGINLDHRAPGLGEEYDSEKHSFERSDRPTEMVMGRQKRNARGILAYEKVRRPMGIFKVGKASRLYDKTFDKITHEVAFRSDPDAFFHTKWNSYRKPHKLHFSRARAGKTDADGNILTDPSYENHFWDWHPAYSSDLRLIRVARYIKKHESDFMLMRGFFGHKFEAYTARPEFALRFYDVHRKNIILPHMYNELGGAGFAYSIANNRKSLWLELFMRNPKKFAWAWVSRYDFKHEERWSKEDWDEDIFANLGPVQISCSPTYIGNASHYMIDLGRCEGYFHARLPQCKVLPREFCDLERWTEAIANHSHIDIENLDDGVYDFSAPYTDNSEYDDMSEMVSEYEYGFLEAQRTYGREMSIRNNLRGKFRSNKVERTDVALDHLPEEEADEFDILTQWNAGYLQIPPLNLDYLKIRYAKYT